MREFAWGGRTAQEQALTQLSASILSEQCSTEKPPMTAGGTPSEYKACTGNTKHTQDDGEAKHVRLCCPGPHSARLSTVRYHLLVSQLHSCSSETEALSENQDTGRNHHFLATSVLQMHCPVGAGTSLDMSRSPEIYVTQCPSVTDCGSSTPCLPCGNIRSSRLKVKL